MITITELLGGSEQIQILTGFLLLFVLFVVRTLVAWTDIDNVTFAVVARSQLGIAMWTIVSACTARDDFISEVLLADLTGILPSAVVQVEVSVVGSASGTVALIREILSTVDWLDVVKSQDVFCLELIRFGNTDDWLFVDLEVRVRDHRIRRNLRFPNSLVNEPEVWLEILVQISDCEHCGIDEIVEDWIVDDLSHFIRYDLQ